MVGWKSTNDTNLKMYKEILPDWFEDMKA